MSKPYDDEFKKRIVRLRFEDGRTIKSICEEYGVSRTAVKTWCKASSQECQSTPEGQLEYDYMLKNRQLRKQLDELEKENKFLNQIHKKLFIHYFIYMSIIQSVWKQKK